MGQFQLFALVSGFLLSFISAALIVGLVYFPANRSKQEYVFAFLGFNAVIYFVATLLSKVEISVGFAFGLVAIFGVMNSRSSTSISMREVTYLFICTALAFVNALLPMAVPGVTIPALVVIDLLFVAMVYVLDTRVLINYHAQRLILYEKYDLIKPENSAQMMEDLRQRTGLDIKGYEIIELDFLRDTATISVSYEPKKFVAVKEPVRKEKVVRAKEVMG